jgi:hypothetical protein
VLRKIVWFVNHNCLDEVFQSNLERIPLCPTHV